MLDVVSFRCFAAKRSTQAPKGKQVCHFSASAEQCCSTASQLIPSCKPPGLHRRPRREDPASYPRQMAHFQRGSLRSRKANSPSIGVRDTQTGMLPGGPKSAICVQRFDDSLISAIHITYRSWLRSSSMHEPRDPPLKIVSVEIL